MNDDSDLVSRAKSGDFKAFEQLASRHERRLYTLAMAIVRQHEDAEDVVRTTLLSVLEHLPDFREQSSFGTWITQIATNAALKVLRKRRGLQSVSLEEATTENAEGNIPHPEYIADWRGDPVKLVEQRELRRILAEAIDALPEKFRLVFMLRDVEGMSIEETAKMLSISEANVKVRLLRARLALREQLTHVFGDASKRVYPSHSH